MKVRCLHVQVSDEAVKMGMKSHEVKVITPAIIKFQRGDNLLCYGNDKYFSLGPLDFQRATLSLNIRVSTMGFTSVGNCKICKRLDM